MSQLQVIAKHSTQQLDKHTGTSQQAVVTW